MTAVLDSGFEFLGIKGVTKSLAIKNAQSYNSMNLKIIHLYNLYSLYIVIHF